MRTILLTLLIGITLLLTGCGFDGPLIVPETKAVLPPDSLLQDCLVETPPSKEAYKAAGDNTTREDAADKREKMLFDFGNKATKNAGLCNVDKKALRDWKAKQQAIYDSEAAAAPAKDKKKD